MNTNQSATMYESVPVVSELNKVQGLTRSNFCAERPRAKRFLTSNTKSSGSV